MGGWDSRWVGIVKSGSWSGFVCLVAYSIPTRSFWMYFGIFMGFTKGLGPHINTFLPFSCMSYNLYHIFFFNLYLYWYF